MANPTNNDYRWLLTILLVSLFMLIALSNPMHQYVFGFLFIFSLCASTFAITRQISHQLFILPTGFLALVIHILFPTQYAPIWLNVVDDFLWISFTGCITYIALRYVFTSSRVGKQQIYGAVSVYLLIGILFAQFYEILIFLQNDAIYLDPSRSSETSIGTSEILYYSFITLATVGYGDMSPFTHAAKALSVVESIIGVMYIAILISRFVANYEKEIDEDQANEKK